MGNLSSVNGIDGTSVFVTFCGCKANEAFSDARLVSIRVGFKTGIPGAGEAGAAGISSSAGGSGGVSRGGGGITSLSALCMTTSVVIDTDDGSGSTLAFFDRLPL